MRRSPTAAEAVAWALLRRKGLFGLRFRRQQIIRGYIVDFYCHELHLAIEIDGGIHDHQQAKDQARQHHLEAAGIRVIRIANEALCLKTLSEGITPYLTPTIPTPPKPPPTTPL